MSATDDVIKKYADELNRIYRARTAGDHTWSGVLGQFLNEINSLPKSKGQFPACADTTCRFDCKAERDTHTTLE